MADEKLLAVLRQGVTTWNQWRWQHRMLPGQALNLSGAHLNGADLSQSHLSEAILSRAILSLADLSEADLSQADLRRADLSRAILSQADVSNAVLRLTILGDIDLSQVKGLSDVRHHGPSTIGVDTLHRSEGKIPEEFLRGAGVPDNFIAYVRSLVGTAIEFNFNSCFISYSSHDQPFAERLHADLRAKNLRCWFAPEDLKIGDRFQERIENRFIPRTHTDSYK